MTILGRPKKLLAYYNPDADDTDAEIKIKQAVAKELESLPRGMTVTAKALALQLRAIDYLECIHGYLCKLAEFGHLVRVDDRRFRVPDARFRAAPVEPRRDATPRNDRHPIGATLRPLDETDLAE
jgi:hypothetical protein